VSAKNLKLIGVICFVVCAVLLFVAWERYEANASKVRAINELQKSSPLGREMGGAELKPATPAATKYALVFAVLAAGGGVACLVVAYQRAPSRLPLAPTETATPELTPWEHTRLVLSYVASLKLTVVLLALGVFLVFAGTMAQTQMDVSEVVDKYFRCAVARVELQVFFPQSFFPSGPAALLGLVAIWAVVASGGSKQGFHYSYRWAQQGRWGVVWYVLLVAISLAWLASVVVTVSQLRKAAAGERRTRFWLLWGALGAQALLGVLLGWLVLGGESARLSDSNMRILWQLMKATFAAAILQVGCWLMFKKKGALVVIHAGIALMMLGELLVGLTEVRARMTIREGETVNFVEDYGTFELAVVDTSDPDKDLVVSVPASMLREGAVIHSESLGLPLELEVLGYLPNTVLGKVAPGPNPDNPATAGIGFEQGVVAYAMRETSGTRGRGGVPSAYVRIYKAGVEQPIGDYLLSARFSVPELIAEPVAKWPALRAAFDRHFRLPERITVDGTTYKVSLRPKRTYKPYSMRLIDAREDRYVGTATAMNYSSDVHLTDPSRGVDRPVKIWMNNPLRFAGETFYQHAYDIAPDTGEGITVLSVVHNAGWMIPYVGCMVVSVGLLVHFWLILVRFARRFVEGEDGARETGKAPAAAGKRRRGASPPPRAWEKVPEWAPPVVAVVAALAWYGSMILPPTAAEGEMDLVAFGRLPVVHEGRVKPLDTLARSTLRIISDRETFKDEEGKRQPAIRWLADVIARPNVGYGHKVFHIQHDQLVHALGLEPRPGYRYAFTEFRDKLGELQELIAQAQAKDAGDVDHFDKKVFDLARRVRVADPIFQALSLPEIRPEHVREDLMRVLQREEMLWQEEPPLLVPRSAQVAGDPRSPPGAGSWQTLGMAVFMDEIRRSGREPYPALPSIRRIISAYGEGDAHQFNRAVAEYQDFLEADPPEGYDRATVAFEAFFNRAALLFWSWILYIAAFVFSCLGLLFWFWRKPIGRAVFWFLVVIFVVHTLALAGRVAISGRPPVTNLYSSAVFVGWAGVVFGLVIQLVFRTGIGNLIASLAGMSTLHIAYFIARRGDTFEVMRAVLDTNFWLTIHVLTIALGYAATFVAGALGVLYILIGVCTPALRQRIDVYFRSVRVFEDEQIGEVLQRMIYGVLCFALFFSFIGTVLGGLWGDDAWGRFWGWDPKENGALIIVLWNALILHALWGRMIGQRGLAVLAVAGNVCTAWSWFGVNELGVGLHSYGFTEGALLKLAIFVATQLAVIAVGLMPLRYWWSYRRRAA